MFRGRLSTRVLLSENVAIEFINLYCVDTCCDATRRISQPGQRSRVS